jgi:hypothetical protein
MKEIIINTQAELDAVDVNFDGIIKILGIGIKVSLRYQYRVVARGNSSVEAWGNSSVEAWGNSSVVAWGNSSVVARENSSVEARENSSVVAWENSSVVAWGNVCVRIFAEIKTLSLFGFSVLFQPFDLKFKFKKEKTCLVQKIKLQKYLNREGIEIKKGSVVLFKKVSYDFKTQENTVNETLWHIGKTVSHHAWNPAMKECGEGKYHACSRPYFCDEFRNNKGDRYIAVQIKVVDLYEWPSPQYPHKIAFKEGKVLYEVDKFGNKVK